MKAFQIGEQNGIASLEVVVRPEPEIGATDILVAPRLVSLNNRDIQIVEGRYGAKKPSDRIPVAEGVGDIVAIGSDVSTLAVGDRIICGHFVNWAEGAFGYHAFGHDIGVTHDGWLAERIRLPASAAIPVPAALDDRQAASLAAASLTAWNALVEVGKVQPGELVLCLGTGGVALAALQIAKAKGAHVAITSSSDEKLEQACAMGADILINYASSPDWAGELMEKSEGRGADIVVETGGPGTLGQSIAAAAVNGRIVIIGVTVGAGTALPNYGTIIGKNLTLRGIANGSRAMLVDLVRFVEQEGIRPAVHGCFDFDDAPGAYACLAAGGHVGKILIAIP